MTPCPIPHAPFKIPHDHRMCAPLSTQQLMEDLYKERSWDPALDQALRNFRKGDAKEEFVSDMLSGFDGIEPRYIVRKKQVFFRGRGLERVYLHCVPNHRVSVIVHRKVLAKFDVQNDPREREALVRWLWNYSAEERKRARKHRRAAVKTNPSSRLPAILEGQEDEIQGKEAESSTAEKEVNSLTVSMAALQH